MGQTIRLKFWGVRGTLPTPGPRSVRYGGNTSCVSVELPGDRLFVFDAGSGIRELGRSLLGRAVRGKIFITHPHWDHINSIPFFAPLYDSANEFEILGPANGDRSIHDLVSAQMDGVYFPITLQDFRARLRFRDLAEGSHSIDGIDVRALQLCHPGACLGYRVDHDGRSVCYVTDNELFPPSSERHSPEFEARLEEFVRGTDALIIDSTYMDDEYPAHEGWGHSAIGRVAELADRAGAGTLFLFHHDPDQSDDDIDRKQETCGKLLLDLKSRTTCRAPSEGEAVTL